MYSEKLKFNENGKFKIMQITDIQEEAYISPDTIRLITLAIKRENPDLIVLTGDQLQGPTPSFLIGDTKSKVKNAIDTISNIFDNENTPFAVTFGNHDRHTGLSNSVQADIYNEHKFCIPPQNANDKGTLRIPLYNDGNHIFDVYLIDSNGQSSTGEYMPVSEEQLVWFKREREIAKEDGKYTPSIVFQHIPTDEFYNVLKKVPFYKKGAVEAFRKHKNEFYILPDEILQKGGFMGETPAVPDRNSGEFSVLKEKGNVLALIVGHDHNNSFVADYEGIKLIYTQCAGFNVYGPHLNRGVRIIELDKNNLSDFNTYTVTYNELTKEKLKDPLKEFILTHIPTSMEQVKRLAVIGTIAGTAVLSGIGYKLYKSK